MKSINLLRKEAEAIDQGLSSLLPPIPHQIAAAANRQVAKVLIECPLELRSEMALALYEMLERHHIPADGADRPSARAQRASAAVIDGAGGAA